MPVPEWAVGMQMLMPGAYCDNEGMLHLDPDELCARAGVPPTDENVKRITDAVVRAIQTCGGTEITIDEAP